MTPLSQLKVRSVLARGNGANIIHSELEKALPFYELRSCSPYLASFPGLPIPGLRNWLAESQIVHLPADYGHVPLPADCMRVITFHNFYTDTENLATASMAQKLFYQQVLRHSVSAAVRSAHRIVVVSRFLADCVRRNCEIPNNVPIDIIYNGIDTQRFRPGDHTESDRPLRVVFVGNPSRRKGFELIRALAEKLPPHVELAFTSGLRGEHVRPNNPRLVSLGRVPYGEMHHVYRQADVLLFPTYREGFGLCVAEAMACGLPVVSSNCSAIPELIDEGLGGYLVPPGDLAAFVERTRRLLSDAELRKAMGSWNRAKAVKEFDRERMIVQYQSLFSSLI